MTELLPGDSPPPRKWTAKRIAITAAKVYGVLVLVGIGGSLLMWLLATLIVRFTPDLSAAQADATSTISNSRLAADGSRLPEVGSTTFIGRTNCDRAVKAILRDPGSYERISAQIVDVKPGEGWAAQIDFRSRNGFGGYDQGTAYCVFNGSEYRALIDE
jgi:hypothetical protein